jgi:RNA polymerase sigma-70 factor (ECF subfamily)
MIAAGVPTQAGPFPSETVLSGTGSRDEELPVSIAFPFQSSVAIERGRRGVATGTHAGTERTGTLAREEDFELVRDLCARSSDLVERAFETLYERYKDRVYGTACRILNDRSLASDVTQETFLLILRKAHKFNFRSAFSSWLYRVAVNLCIDTRRKRSRRRPLSLSEPEVAAWADRTDRRRNPAEGPETAAHREELSVAVERAIADLNPKLATVVVLRYVDGLGYEEIAEILGMPLGTVKSRLNRAHSALESQLGPRLDDYNW